MSKKKSHVDGGDHTHNHPISHSSRTCGSDSARPQDLNCNMENYHADLCMELRIKYQEQPELRMILEHLNSRQRGEYVRHYADMALRFGTLVETHPDSEGAGKADAIEDLIINICVSFKLYPELYAHLKRFKGKWRTEHLRICADYGRRMYNKKVCGTKK